MLQPIDYHIVIIEKSRSQISRVIHIFHFCSIRSLPPDLWTRATMQSRPPPVGMHPHTLTDQAVAEGSAKERSRKTAARPPINLIRLLTIDDAQQTRDSTSSFRFLHSVRCTCGERTMWPYRFHRFGKSTYVAACACGEYTYDVERTRGLIVPPRRLCLPNLSIPVDRAFLPPVTPYVQVNKKKSTDFIGRAGCEEWGQYGRCTRATCHCALAASNA